MSKGECVFQLVCPHWVGRAGLVAQPHGVEPPQTPWPGSSSLLRASGKWAHFWVCNCGFTETTDLFLVRGWWSGLMSYSLGRWSVTLRDGSIYQGTIDGSRAMWNLDYHTEFITQDPPLTCPGLV